MSTWLWAGLAIICLFMAIFIRLKKYIDDAVEKEYLQEQEKAKPEEKWVFDVLLAVHRGNYSEIERIFRNILVKKMADLIVKEGVSKDILDMKSQIVEEMNKCLNNVIERLIIKRKK